MTAPPDHFDAAARASSLRVALLGRFALEWDGAAVVAVETPRLQALLAYLILHRGAPQPRAQLAYLFWPDSTKAQAHTNLRGLALRLRRALPTVDRCLEGDRLTLRWRPDAPCAVDVIAFEAALARAAVAHEEGRAAPARAALEEAVALYAGDLLPDCYDDWALPERDRLRGACIDALERLIGLLEAAGEPQAALAQARRLLRLDPLREATYRALMRLHAATGDRAAALRVYDACVTMLDRELGVAPDAATHRAYLRQLHPKPVGARHQPPPAPANPLLGRAAEVAQIARRLTDPGCRLLTLVGPGGVGKTRLAIAAIGALRDAFADGICFAALAPVADARLVLPTVAAALGVAEMGGRSLAERLVAYLGDKELLLVLDNLEHLPDAAPLVAELLVAAPCLRVLATSRAPLRLAAERRLTVSPLPLPDPVAPDLAGSAAVQLFAERARAARDDFRLAPETVADIAAICARLDGLPLAIELAAARVTLFTPRALLARLDGGLALLTGGLRDGPARHRALRATIDWSYDLLAPSEQALFARLGVFAGGWTVDAAAAVDGDAAEIAEAGRPPAALVLDRLQTLVDHSLVQRAATLVGDGVASACAGSVEPRLTMLETVRAFALEQLEERGEVAVARARHARYFVALAEAAEPRLASVERADWVAWLAAEHDNLRAALAWTLEHEPAAGLRAAGALWWFWCFRGHIGEGRRWVEEALARAGDAPLAARAKALTTAGLLAWAQGDLPTAEARCAAAVVLYRAGDYPAGLASALVWQATVAWWLRKLDVARARFVEAVELARRTDDCWWLAFALRWRGDRMLAAADPAAWRRDLEESLGLFRATGDPWGVAVALEGLGQFHQAQGDFTRARALLEEALALRRELGDAWFTAYSLRNLGELEHQTGRDEQAEGLITESLAAFLQLGTRQAVADLHYWLGRIAQARGDGARAAARFREGFGLARAVGNEWAVALCLAGLAGVAAVWGQPGQAARALAAAEPVLASIPPVMPIADRTAYDRDVAAARARLGEAAFARAWAAGRSLGMEQARTVLETALPE